MRPVRFVSVAGAVMLTLTAALPSSAGATPVPTRAPTAAVVALASPDPSVVDPPGTVAVPQSPEFDPVARQVIGAVGDDRALLQPDADGTTWLWWQHGTDAPVRSNRVVQPQSPVASQAGDHVMVGAGTSWLSVDVVARQWTAVSLLTGWRMVAATPDGWLEWDPQGHVLRRRGLDGSTVSVPLDPAITSLGAAPSAAADATGVAAVATGGVRWIPFDGSPGTLLTSSPQYAATVAVSAHAVAWATKEWAGSASLPHQDAAVHRVAKSGGPEAVLPVSTVTGLAITDDSTAWVGTSDALTIPGPTTSFRFAGVAGADLGDATTVAGMNGTSVVADGDHFLLTDEKPVADAGLYTVSASASATKVASTTPPLQAVRAFAYDGQYLADEGVERHASRTVSVRAISADGTAGPAADLPGPSRTTYALEASAGRFAVSAGSTRLVDAATRSTLTTLPGTWAPGGGVLSAQTAATTSAVSDTSGRELYVPAGAVTVAAFGETVVWSTARGEVWRRTAVATPVRLVAAACSTTCAARVGIWGGTVVVQPASGGLQVRRLDGTLVRTLSALPATGAARDVALTVEDDVLAWVERASTGVGVLRVMDLRAGAPQPVDVARAWQVPGQRAVELRDGQLVWVSPDDRALRVAPSPARAPRVLPLTLSAPNGFSPNGDGTLDTWPLTVVASAPLEGPVRVVLRRAGAVVRTIVTTAPSGRLAVTWDGRADDGTTLPDGAYTWSVEATSLHGRPLSGLNGALSGSVQLRRSVAAVTVSAPEVVSNVSTTAIFPVRWRPATPQPAWSTVTYQLQAAGREAGSRQWDGWQQWDVGAATSRTFDLRTTFWPTARQWRFRVRATAAGGVPGRWSAYAPATIPVDDGTRSATTYSGSWTAQRVSGTFMGTQHRANRRGASVTVWPNTQARLMRVVMTTCPRCGKVQIRVDGGSWLTVDTYSRTVVRRKLVYRSTKPSSDHRVTVRSVASGARPYVYLDGVVFEP